MAVPDRPPPPTSAAEPDAPRPDRRRLARRGVLAALATGIAAGGCSVLDARQGAWIFQPSGRRWRDGDWPDGVHDTWIDFRARDGDDVRLHALWLPADTAEAPALLYLHGARWDLSGSLRRMQRMHDLGYAVLGIDYRGFGRSTATPPSEQRAYEDALAAWRWLAAREPGRARYVFGHSLGGAIAVHVAAHAEDVAGLIVEGSFTSIPDLVDRTEWGWLPLGPLITQRFDAGAQIARVRAPVLVVHGSEDRLIDPALGRALFERVAHDRRRFVLVAGGSHHDTHALAQDAYRDAMQTLFRR